MEQRIGTPRRWRRRRRIRIGAAIVLLAALITVVALGFTGKLSGYVHAWLVEAARKLPPHPPVDSDYFGLTMFGQLPIPHGMMYLDTDGSTMREIPTNGAEYERETNRKLWYLRMALRLDPENEAVASELGYALHLLGRHQEAVQYLGQLTYGPRHPRQRVALARSYEHLGLIDQAIEAVGYDSAIEVEYHLAYLLQREGRLEEAGRIYDQLSKRQSVSTRIRTALEERAQTLLAGTESLATVFGRITVNGEGVPGAEVFLWPDLTSTGWSRPSSSQPQVMVMGNPDGTFRLYGVPPGEYVLGAHVPFDRIAGTNWLVPQGKLAVEPGQEVEVNLSFESPPRVTSLKWIDSEPHPLLDVAWEPHDNLVAYDLVVHVGAGGTSYGHGIPNWTSLITSENTAQIPLDDRFFSNTNGWGVNPQGDVELAYVFGLLHPAAEISVDFRRNSHGTESAARWRAMPEAEDLNEPPTLKAPQLPLSKADRLLLDREYSEAIAAYEQQLAQNPGDTHALAVLGYIFYYGVDSKGTFKDMQRAVDYTHRLAEALQRTP